MNITRPRTGPPPNRSNSRSPIKNNQALLLVPLVAQRPQAVNYLVNSSPRCCRGDFFALPSHKEKRRMGSTPWTLTARWILSMEGPPLEEGTVVIQDQRIAAVEPHGRCTADLDLGNAAVLPGLVNAH